MSAGPEALSDDIETLQAALVVARAEVAIVRAQQSDDQALIAHLKLQIEKLNRDRYGPRSERTARLLDQLELTLVELESSATEDELAAEMAVAKTTKVASFTRKRPSRKPFPEHLPRERVIVPGPTACSCCGGLRLSRLGEDITETLEVIPKSWKVIQHVREKFTCRDCEKISQAPAPFHVIARGWADRQRIGVIGYSGGGGLSKCLIGRTDLFGGSGRDLLTSIVSKLLVLDDDTVVLPGHGPKSTIGDERRTNPFLEGL